MASVMTRQLLNPADVGSSLRRVLSPISGSGAIVVNGGVSTRQPRKLRKNRTCGNVISLVVRSSTGNPDASQAGDGEDGVPLGTMRLPLNTDLQRFETLLFQWANSLCQGANLPLPVPLKVDRIPGGARLGFINIGQGTTEVTVYIDCVVYADKDGSGGPMFRAVRKGPMKDKAPPGEPRIMKSLLQALQTSVEIASV